MLPFIIRRFFHLIPTFIGATLLAFVISQLVPGDFLTQKALEPDVRPETIDRLRQQFGLDLPWPVQYGKWIWNIVRGDLGMSFDSNQPVINVVRRPIQNSMYLVILSIVLLYAVAIPLGVYSAVRQYSIGDQVVSVVSYFGLAIPNFFFAQVLILGIFVTRSWTREAFGFNELLLPVAQMTSSNYLDLSPLRKFLDILWHMLMPAFVVATAGMAGFTRVLRAQMLEVLGSDFIRTARAKGLGHQTVTYKHALRNAVIPFIAGIGGLLPGLIGGAGLVEVVVSWPGITPTFLQALSRQDIYVVLGLLVVSSILLMIGNLISDLLLAVVDPRIRYH
ncbi:MAG: ABC transporter permease [Trueperaceae bacterium]|nr:MAG: ABC transporter permease [Trueperaceae bacterium]